MDLLYTPVKIPLQTWLDKYGEDRVKVRDALQRKCPHFVDGTLNIVFWTVFINSQSPDPLAVVALQILHRAAWLTTNLGLFLIYSRTGYWYVNMCARRSVYILPKHACASMSVHKQGELGP